MRRFFISIWAVVTGIGILGWLSIAGTALGGVIGTIYDYHAWKSLSKTEPWQGSWMERLYAGQVTAGVYDTAIYFFCIVAACCLFLSALCIVLPAPSIYTLMEESRSPKLEKVKSKPKFKRKK